MSNFKCTECGTINIDCGKEGYKTPREIELEERLKIAEEALTKISKLNLVMKHNGYTYHGFEDFLGKKEAEEALEKIKGVK